ncbi:arginyltransferase [Zooshikella sp. RANM57]|uniref:arginyltransferase n=1 Tax=Zooshikella sp. RANM57 TaxID=3425863 RepID=UPI003D6DCB29
MSELKELKFFATHPHTCSYLPDQEATTLFLDPSKELSTALYSQLTDFGFRRSGQHLYRPHCRYCQACIPARIPVTRFQRKRRFQRIWNRNKDLVVEVVNPYSEDEIYHLYEKYIFLRHQDGDMFPPSKEQFESFLVGGWDFAQFYLFWEQSRLIAVAVTDQLDNGLSAIYTFYDPEYSQRSLGTFAVLWQVEACQLLGLDYVYLGYWIKSCQKMQYKGEYRPLEVFVNNKWIELQ